MVTLVLVKIIVVAVVVLNLSDKVGLFVSKNEEHDINRITLFYVTQFIGDLSLQTYFAVTIYEQVTKSCR